MRRLRYEVAASLDGYIAGPNGEFDWIPMDPDIDFAEMLSEFDTLLMGRKTFEIVTDRTPYAGMKFVVCSRTLSKREHPDIQIVGDDLAGVVRAMKAEPGKDIWLFGGGELFRVLAEMKLVDTVEVAVLPIVLGGGIPLLQTPGPRMSLKLTRHRVYEKSGIVMLRYDIA